MIEITTASGLLREALDLELARMEHAALMGAIRAEHARTLNARHPPWERAERVRRVVPLKRRAMHGHRPEATRNRLRHARVPRQKQEGRTAAPLLRYRVR